MGVVKSFSVGEGDMFYIKHDSDNFTVIDCCICIDCNKCNVDEKRRGKIIREIKEESNNKGIKRFISTHPDMDHIGGLKFLNENWKILNFYCVKNKANKEDETEDFKEYKKLRDDKEKAFYLYKGCKRKWMNISDDERKRAGIEILWSIEDNEEFKKVLDDVENNNKNYNNLSPIIEYKENKAVFIWMGDLESNFMEKIKDEVKFENKVDVLFAPHHGRESGTIPKEWLEIMEPKLIVIGEAPSENLNYYKGYVTITQNSAKDILFEEDGEYINIFVEDITDNNKKDLIDRNLENKYGLNYLGSFEIHKAQK